MKSYFTEFPLMNEPIVIVDSKKECGSKFSIKQKSTSNQEKNYLFEPSLVRSSKTEQYEYYSQSGGTLTFEEYSFSQYLK